VTADGWEVVATGDIRMRWSPADGIQPTDEQEQEVDYYWQRAVEESGGQLFNGTFLNLISYKLTETGLRALTHFAEYKYFYVHRLRPKLGLRVKAIGVSGITLVEGDMALVARRGESMTQYPGLLELVPSGTVDRSCADEDGTVRYEAKLLEELREETGVLFSRVEEVRGFAFTHDRVDNSYDACCLVRLGVRGQDMLDAFDAGDEYTEPRLVHVTELPAFVERHEGDIMPVTKGLVEAYVRFTEAVR